ncbi:hypothetical protein CYY_006340 [Polysphondylium violaceum]|uniref:Uncharacterized protein n=1 Tax=Polysphondylium violaceum TaxID=133409 RepID=A0A8J4UY91_9MYCE|nr:hypothetical protein CYY_006340 [Polysphondylium violaceum]
MNKLLLQLLVAVLIVGLVSGEVERVSKKKSFPGRGVLQIRREGTNNGRFVKISLWDFKTLINNKQLSQQDIDAIKAVYDKPDFISAPNKSRFAPETVPNGHFIYIVVIPNSPNYKTFAWTSGYPGSPAWLHLFENLLDKYGIPGNGK